MAASTYDVCAIGNAMVDIVADVPELFIPQNHIPKDGMALVDHAHITLLRKSVKNARAVRAGGAASNMVAGVASFGGRAAYLGKVAYDEVGHFFSKDLEKLHVHYPTPPVSHDGAATGLCLNFVTPGVHRSMATFLGVSVEFGAADLDVAVVRGSQVLYVEGYLFDRPGTRAAAQAAASMAREAKRKVALSLCDPACVDRNRAEFIELIRTKTDIIFANEKELMALYKTFHLDAAIAEIKTHVETAVITRSDKGSMIVHASRQLAIQAEPVPRLVDKTGAGDLYAAGFLFGLARDFDLSWCGKLGAIAAAEVIGHYGPRPEHSLEVLAKQKGVLL